MKHFAVLVLTIAGGITVSMVGAIPILGVGSTGGTTLSLPVVTSNQSSSGKTSDAANVGTSGVALSGINAPRLYLGATNGAVDPPNVSLTDGAANLRAPPTNGVSTDPATLLPADAAGYGEGVDPNTAAGTTDAAANDSSGARAAAAARPITATISVSSAAAAGAAASLAVRVAALPISATVAASASSSVGGGVGAAARIVNVNVTATVASSVSFITTNFSVVTSVVSRSIL